MLRGQGLKRGMSSTWRSTGPAFCFLSVSFLRRQEMRGELQMHYQPQLHYQQQQQQQQQQLQQQLLQQQRLQQQQLQQFQNLQLQMPSVWGSEAY